MTLGWEEVGKVESGIHKSLSIIKNFAFIRNVSCKAIGKQQKLGSFSRGKI
jgi:hypothetical protein